MLAICIHVEPIERHADLSVMQVTIASYIDLLLLRPLDSMRKGVRHRTREVDGRPILETKVIY
jgi:hypothetical protein